MSDGNALKRTHNAAGAAASSHGATPTDVPHSATRNIDATESARSTSRPPVQYAAVRAFQGDVRIQRYLWHARRILASLGARSYEILDEAGVNVLAPEGGFYLFPDFTSFKESLAARGITNSKQMCTRLLEETGVAVLPGSAFNRPPDELTARLAFVNFDGGRALAASETTPIDQPLPEGFVERWCEETLEAMSRIADWIWDRGSKA